MDLNNIVSGVIQAVNPRITLTISLSNGYTTGLDGKRAPLFKPSFTRLGQVQPMQYRDLIQVEGLNLSGTRRKIYIEGPLSGVQRSSKQGGDLIVDPSGNVWLVADVLEAFPDWTSVAATLQVGA